MTGFATIFLVSAIGYGFSRWLRLPVIPLLLLGGVGLSISGLAPEHEFAGSIVELGLTFLVFAAGIEMNPQRIKPQRAAIFWVGPLQFAFAGIAGFLLALVFGFGTIPALYLGFAMSTSSTLVVIRQLRARQQMFEPFGRLVIGVLLLQDVIMIVGIVLISRAPEGWAATVTALGGTLVCAAAAYILQKRVLSTLVLKTGIDLESLLLGILALLFVFLAIAYKLKLPPFVGAFLAGFALSSFPVNGVARGVLNSLNDFFIALFFTAVGAHLMIPSLADLGMALAFASVVVFITPPVVTAVAEWKGMSSRSAIESGLLLAQLSEFSLVVGLTGQALGHIDARTLSIIAVAAVVTMTLTPLMATPATTRLLLHLHPLRRRRTANAGMSDHALILGFGSSGMWTLRPLKAAGFTTLVVDDDPAVISQLEKMNVPCVRGDASDERILETAGARHAKLILVSMRRVRDSEKVLRYAKDVPTFVRVFEETEAEFVRERGGEPILNSAAAVETFTKWFETNPLFASTVAKKDA
jgi:CPA2 family monovalent cation:H+ antiporter-2